MKRYIVSCLLLLLPVLFSACSKNTDGAGSSAQGSASEESVSEVIGDADGDFREIYTQTVRENMGEDILFSLIYLDDDEVPELVVYDSFYGSCSIYTIKDDAAVCLMDQMTAVELTYFEQSGVVALFARWNGGGDEGGYGWYYYQLTDGDIVTDDSVPALGFTYNALCDEAGVYTGRGVTDYTCAGRECDEATYREKADALGITEDGGRVCWENAVSGEEMRSLLTE